MDTEAIRNLGAISKSILTGKNYHNLSGNVTPGKLVIPANVEIQGSLKTTSDVEIRGNRLKVHGNIEGVGALALFRPGLANNKCEIFNQSDGGLEIKNYSNANDKVRIYSVVHEGGRWRTDLASCFDFEHGWFKVRKQGTINNDQPYVELRCRDDYSEFKVNRTTDGSLRFNSNIYLDHSKNLNLIGGHLDFDKDGSKTRLFLQTTEPRTGSHADSRQIGRGFNIHNISLGGNDQNKAHINFRADPGQGIIEVNKAGFRIFKPVNWNDIYFPNRADIWYNSSTNVNGIEISSRAQHGKARIHSMDNDGNGGSIDFGGRLIYAPNDYAIQMPRLYLTGWHGIGVKRGGNHHSGWYSNTIVTGRSDGSEHGALPPNFKSEDPSIPGGRTQGNQGTSSGFLGSANGSGHATNDTFRWKIVPDINSDWL